MVVNVSICVGAKIVTHMSNKDIIKGVVFMEGKMRDDLQVVVFYLGKEEYALPIMKVQEINKIEQLTKMPHTPDFMEGIINLLFSGNTLRALSTSWKGKI
jgi:hypothetical protein